MTLSLFELCSLRFAKIISDILKLQLSFKKFLNDTSRLLPDFLTCWMDCETIRPHLENS